MNYYLARDGQTYGPYPEEDFPGMIQAGQVIPEDLVCPEGSADWIGLSLVPALAAHLPKPVAAPAVAAVAALATAQPASSSAPGLRVAAVAPRAEPEPHVINSPLANFTPVQPRRSFMDRVEGFFHHFKAIAYGTVILIFAICGIFGFLATKHDQKEIAKLHSQPGWKAFDSGNSQIDSESAQAGYGNNESATKAAKALASVLASAQKLGFEFEKTPRLRGRSKVGLVLSAVDAATAGTGKFETYVDLRNDRALVLVHVPEYRRYKSDARDAMRELCFEAAATSVLLLPGAIKKGSDFALVVGVRDKNSYDCVYVIPNVSKINKDSSAPPLAAKGNVPSHQLLVKWFGEEKP